MGTKFNLYPGGRLYLNLQISTPKYKMKVAVSRLSKKTRFGVASGEFPKQLTHASPRAEGYRGSAFHHDLKGAFDIRTSSALDAA
jgi:hypothetical protein